MDLSEAVDWFLARGASRPPGRVRLAPAPSLLGFIVQGLDALDLAGEAVERAVEAGVATYPGVRLQAPWPGRRMICGGANHPVHVARALTAEFSLSFGETLAAVSRRLSLAPGDFVSGGIGIRRRHGHLPTSIGWRMARRAFLKVGDRVEASCEQIGVLSSTISPYRIEPACI